MSIILNFFKLDIQECQLSFGNPKQYKQYKQQNNPKLLQSSKHYNTMGLEEKQMNSKGKGKNLIRLEKNYT